MLVSYSHISSDSEPPDSEELRNWKNSVNFSKVAFQNPKCQVINEAFPQAELILFHSTLLVLIYTLCPSFFLVLLLVIHKSVFTRLPILLDCELFKSKNYVLLTSVILEHNIVLSTKVSIVFI